MKKTLILSAFLAAFAFAGCNKAEKVAPAAAETRTVFFQAVSQDTKAAFTSPVGNQYPVLWTENDTQVAVVQNYDDATNVDVTVSGDKKTASFEAELKTGAEENKLIAVIPASSVRSVSSTNKTLNIEIPAAQTSSLTSPDEDAMVLYAKESLDGTIPASVNLTFQHFSAYLHLTFSNYADALTAAGASVQAVSITSAKEIAGRAFFYPETGSTSPNAMFKTVTVSTSTLEDVWAGLVPVDFSGETLTLVVNTDKGTMTRNITFPDGRNLTSGKVANIPVDMSGISLIEPVVYKLVTSENQLHVGDKVIVAAANYDVAISTTQNSNNRATAGITKSDGVILDPAAAVEVITLEDGVKPGEYALKAGAGYLYAASLTGSGNYLRTAAADDITPELAKYGSWNISIFDTVQHDNNSEKTETQNAAKVIAKAASQGLLRYNGANNNNLFSAYQDNHGSTYLIHLYRLDKPADETPRFKASMPDADGENQVATSAAAKDNIEVYVFGNSAWTASVTGGATLSETVGTGNTILTLSVPENTSTTDTKSYTVTVSTTAEVATKSYSFTVNQSAAPSGDGPKVGDVLWEEWWTGGVASQTPAEYYASADKSTTVYDNAVITYTSTGSGTKLYADGLVFYQSNPAEKDAEKTMNLLISKGGSNYLQAAGIPCSGIKTATLTYRSNYAIKSHHQVNTTAQSENLSLSATSTGKLNDSTKNTYTISCEISIPQGTETLTVKITNTSSNDNVRVDGIELVVTEVW